MIKFVPRSVGGSTRTDPSSPASPASASTTASIAGSQTTRVGRSLRELNLPCDVLATSDDWGATKPDVAFFSKLIAVSGHSPNKIAYVSDRLDNDLRPAATAGLHCR